ncbi:hypothetical protein [Seohaeicola sp.]
MVLTIGKSVQYAMAARRPVYVYDRFGGPGWITSENFKNAEKFNFSGRCVGQEKRAEEIASEILARIDQGFDADCYHDVVRDRFRLSAHVKSAFTDLGADSMARQSNYRPDVVLESMFKREKQSYEDQIFYRNRRRKKKLFKAMRNWLFGKLHIS